MLNITVGPIIDLVSDQVVMEEIEHWLPQTTVNIYVKILSGIILAQILVSNGTLFYYISKKESKLTVLDKMMFLDSILGIILYVTIITINGSGAANLLFLVIFCSYCKVFLTKGIVVYRYVFVVKNSWIPNSRQRFIFIFLFTTVILSSLITGAFYYYRDNWLTFLSKII